MWKVEQIANKNYQIFYRIKDGFKEEVKAPITIGNGRYKIDGVLSNSGGFGVVFTAKDKNLLDRNVLVKARKYSREGLFTHKINSEREQKIKQIRRDTLFEYNALGIFKKNKESRMPNVNNIVHGFSPELYGPHTTINGDTFFYENEEVYNSEPYLVMQIIEGENLAYYAEKNRPKFSPPMWEVKVLEIAKEITTMLKDIHKIQKTEKGTQYYYIYRDLKPDNIMLTGGRYITLLDFGGIQLIRQNRFGEFVSNTDGSGAKGIGTVGFQAPETIEISMISKLDNRVDIYTLGATMFNLFVGGNIMNSIDSKTNLLDLSKLDGKCSDDTRRLIEKCVQFNRDNRFSNMQEVLKLINTCFTTSKNYWKSKTSEAETV